MKVISNVVGNCLTPAVPISGWQEFLQNGKGYLQTAVNAHIKEKAAFTNVILYNLTAMAIEKFCMGYLMYHGDLADNHTMADLAAAVERHAGLQPELTKKFLFIDSFQEICDMNTYKRRPPDEAEIAEILTIGLEVKEFISSKIGKFLQAAEASRPAASGELIQKLSL